MASSNEVGSPNPSGSDGQSRPIACLRCRYRKSYCSKEQPQCSRCRASGLECEYEESRKINVSESYLRGLQTELRQLEAKVRAYEDAISKQNATIAIQRPRTPHKVEEGEVIDADALLEPFKKLGTEQPGMSPSYKGPEAPDTFLHNIGNQLGIVTDGGNLDQNTHFCDPDALPSRRMMVRSHMRLPPFDVARRLYMAQYAYIGTIFSFCDPADFDELLVSAANPATDILDRESGLAFAKLLVLLAFGQLYSVNQWIGFNGPPGFEYFTAALQFLPDIHERGSLLFVETLALIGYFMQNMNRRDAALLYVGLASRMAISMGLHQEVSSPELDDQTRERRRRVWWSVYSLDRILSAKSGAPLSIADRDIGVALPSKLADEPEYCRGVVLKHYTVLSQILGEITRTIYRKSRKAGARLAVADVQNIMKSLSKWHKELPEPLRFDPSRSHVSRESVSTLLHYYMCLNMTARPLFFHVVQKRLRGGPIGIEADWKEGLSKTTVGVIEMCVDAARGTVNMMTMAAKRDLVATYGYMDSEHAFAAAIVLVMVCVVFPPLAENTAAMKAALQLLRAMASRGNTHIANRLRLLEQLRCMSTGGSPPLMASSSTPGPGPVPVESLYPSSYSFGIGPFGAGSPVLGFVAPGLTGGSPMAWPVATNTPTFPLVDTDLGEVLFDGAPGDEGDALAGHHDVTLWEEGFACPEVDVSADLTMWTETMEREFTA